jgi:fumarate reductase subunit C
MSRPYTPYHPRWYRKHVSTYWWLGSWRYTKFILRELSSLAVAWVVVMTLFQVGALLRGPEAYAKFAARLESPLLIAINIIALGLALLHTITWFNLAPAALAVRVGGKRVPNFFVAAPNFALWIVASVIVGWFVVKP